jgi:hypothetical protein
MCLTPTALHDAFRVRYDSYSEKKFIEKNENWLFFDHYDAMPNSITFATYLKNEVVATIRASVYSNLSVWDNIPAMTIYPNEFSKLRMAGSDIVEWNRFAICPLHSNLSAKIEFALLGCVPFFASYFENQIFVAAVREHHTKFYSRFGYETISQVKKYPGLNFSTTLMAMDWIKHKDRIKNHRYFSECFNFLPSLENIDSRSKRFFDARFSKIA